MTTISAAGQFGLFALKESENATAEVAASDAPIIPETNDVPNNDTQPARDDDTGAIPPSVFQHDADGVDRIGPASEATMTSAVMIPAMTTTGVTGSLLTPPDQADRPRTLEDALTLIEGARALAPETLRRIRSDITVAARCIELPHVHTQLQQRNEPRDIPCDPVELRPLLAAVLPARSGRSRHRWSSIKASIARALQLTGWIEGGGARRAPLPEPWLSAKRRLPHAARQAAFRIFGHFCIDRGIAPEAVANATMDAFRTHRLATTLDMAVSNMMCALRRAWNDLAGTDPAWAGRRLASPRRLRTLAMPFAEMDPTFVQEVEAYLARLADPGPFDRTIGKPRSPVTLGCLKGVFQRAATVLLQTGWKPNEVRSLHDLLRPNAVEAILRDQYRRLGNGNRWAPGTVTIASYLKMAAKHCPTLSAEDRVKVNELCGCVKVTAKGLSRKIRQRLAQFDDPAVMRRWMGLPDACFAKADQLFAAGTQIRAAQIHQRGLALAILIAKPLRRSELAILDLRRHFRKDSRKRLHYFCIPAEQVKNGQDVEVSLPEPVIRRLMIHVSKYRPLLDHHGTSFLFPGRDGGHISAQVLATALKRLVQNEVGAEFSAHFVRHLAATLLLDADPTNGPIAQRLLGHTDQKTTLRAYGAQRTRGAQLAYARILEERAAKARNSTRGRR